ncbi:hypothetical protein AZ46_0216575 [Metabacillus indicus LMG 22858]|nr:hypothetical protein AZ46_0216575 [Metabacillus indicus LMG 22858]
MILKLSWIVSQAEALFRSLLFLGKTKLYCGNRLQRELDVKWMKLAVKVQKSVDKTRESAEKRQKSAVTSHVPPAVQISASKFTSTIHEKP